MPFGISAAVFFIIRHACRTVYFGARFIAPNAACPGSVFGRIDRRVAGEVFAVSRAAFKQPRRHCQRAAAYAQNAADRVIKTAGLLFRRVDNSEPDAFRHVEHRLPVVSLQFMAVEVYRQIGIDVGHTASDDERIVDVVRHFDIAVTVFDCGEKLVDRVDFNLFGDYIFQTAGIFAVGSQLF